MQQARFPAEKTKAVEGAADWGGRGGVALTRAQPSAACNPQARLSVQAHLSAQAYELKGLLHSYIVWLCIAC